MLAYRDPTEDRLTCDYPWLYRMGKVFAINQRRNAPRRFLAWYRSLWIRLVQGLHVGCGWPCRLCE